MAGLATSQFDVAIISLGFVSFIAAGRPIVASNSLVHYTMYFVALAGTGLRYDPRVCLAAGGAALLQYGAIVTWVAVFEPAVWSESTVYGVFQWDSQVSRLQLIAVATMIHAAVVVRSRGTSRALIDAADRRLYAAKAAGRNRTVADGHLAA